MRSWLFYICFSSFLTLGQSNVSLQYFGLTIHPFGDYSAEVQPYRLDDNANFVLNFGGYLSYEKYVWHDILSIRVKQGAFTDCSAGKMGVSHIGVNFRLIGNEKHRLHFSFGPAFIYRESWNRFEVYKNKGFWNDGEFRGDEWQYKMVPFSCEFEYNYTINEKWDATFFLTPGFPNALFFSIGTKYWFNKDYEPREKLMIRE